MVPFPRSVSRPGQYFLLFSGQNNGYGAHHRIKNRHPEWGALCFLAAGALADIAASVLTVAAAAEQNCQDDNPPDVAATEAVTVTHNNSLRNS